MNIFPFLLKELEQESEKTEKFLKIVPVDKFDWKPHEKSMTLKALTTHIAEIPGWIHMALTTDYLDFADGYEPSVVNNNQDLIELLNSSVSKSLDALTKANEEEFLKTWTMKNGDQIYMAMTKYEVIRHAFDQLIHHRAQLGVFLRLLDIPIPGTYGPSADESNFS